MTGDSTARKELETLDREIQLLGHIAAQLTWDQETYMPPKAVTERADQLATLEAAIHRRGTDPRLGDLLSEAEAEGDGGDSSEAGAPDDERRRALLREMRRTYDRRTKLPAALVTEIARQASINQAAWVRARNESDFTLFSSELERTLQLILEKAACLATDASTSPYDALLDEFEPYMRTTDVTAIFDNLRPALVDLLQRVRGSAVTIDDGVLGRSYDLTKQKQVSESLLRSLGFESERGRLDVSAHPFSTTLGADDVRLTTRFATDLLSSSMFGTMHECGHGLYELGVDPKLGCTELSGGVSLGIHESQSRFWENMVGRSRPFWEHFLPQLKQTFPAQLADQSVDSFYAAINRVAPSFIRVEADEVTYNLHILLRFSLERRLVEGDLVVADLPEAWAQESEELLGVRPTRAADGVLQDIHWSAFLIGYFPTYTLGNLYSAQLANVMAADLGDVDALVRNAEFAPLLGWMRDKIHRHGRVYAAGELCRRATGEPLNAKYFVAYLEQKYRDLYRL